MKIKMYVFILCMMSFSMLVAQSIDWNITGAGARAAGFGGAFIGVADDATAIVWNPAGLTQLEKPEASVVVKNVSEDDKYENTTTNQSATYSQSHGALNFISVATPLSASKVVGAIAWQQQVDGYFKNDYSKRTGGINAISIGAAIPFGKIVSCGFAGNVWTGSMKTTEPDYVKSTSYTDKFSGVNFVLGLMADFSGNTNPSPLKLGLTIRTPFELTDEYDNGELTRITVKDKFGMPTMIGIGASYRFGESLTLAMDYESRQYSQSKYKSAEGYEYKVTKYDLNQVRLGGEYLILAPGFRIPIRLGLQTVPTLYSNYDQNGDPKDQVIGSGIAIGTGFITDRFSLDLTITGRAYEINAYDESWDQIKETYSNGTMYVSGIVYF